MPVDSSYADACVELEDALASLHNRFEATLSDKEFAEELRRYAATIDGKK